MFLATDSRDREGPVPRLADGWDPSGCQLSPGEGFLLSRIDGCTPWSVLREIGGIPADDVDRCLERWVSEGIVVVEGKADLPPGDPAHEAAETAAASVAPEIAADAIDPALDLPVEFQRRVLAFEAGLDRPYHQLLDVPRNADAKAIKRAYFALSKEFHPDRYYRRKIGEFGPRFERIFKKVVEAYELLSDPATRAEIERSMADAPPAAAGAAAAPGTPQGKRARLEQLRRRFRIPESVLVERRFKARQFFQSALISARRERWLETAASVRLAIAFDPWNDDYKQHFAEVQGKVHQVRAAELLERADASLDAQAQTEAMRLLEEALHYRPSDPEIHARAANLALELVELDRARGFAEEACELAPEVAAYERTLGLVLAGAGLRDKAKQRLEKALALDPNDELAKKALRALRRSRRRP